MQAAAVERQAGLEYSLDDFLYRRENVMYCLRRRGEGRRSGFSERRFKDGNVLLDSATAHADARDQLALLGEWRSTAHRTIPSLG